MKEVALFLQAVLETEISHLELGKLKLIELRRAQAGPDQFNGAAVNAIDIVIQAKKLTAANLSPLAQKTLFQPNLD